VKRLLVVAAILVLVVAASAGLFLWRTSGGGEGEASIKTASLRPGEIDLLIANDSGEPTRLAQIILNDAYVDFRAHNSRVRPGQTTRVRIFYPWIAGENYDLEILTATGASIEYEIEDAEAA
jgi:zinc transporter, ZIP family